MRRNRGRPAPTQHPEVPQEVRPRRLPRSARESEAAAPSARFAARGRGAGRRPLSHVECAAAAVARQQRTKLRPGPLYARPRRPRRDVQLCRCEPAWAPRHRRYARALAAVLDADSVGAHPPTARGREERPEKLPQRLLRLRARAGTLSRGARADRHASRRTATLRFPCLSHCQLDGEGPGARRQGGAAPHGPVAADRRRAPMAHRLECRASGGEDCQD
mmetsp:Transcript_2965/g.10403  ORF Transcript_2965/g.10403 Transcript_2965/m.10403 type:complete len:219 (+) Transcript_2965:433-1089(+)